MSVATPSPSKTTAQEAFVERIVSLYGDLLYDLAASVLISQNNAQVAFRRVLRRLAKEKKRSDYVEYERAWILRVAYETLLPMTQRYGVKLSPSEQLLLDASLGRSERLAQFDSYLHRLKPDEQILLLLRDKYGFSYAEIASALGEPEASLRLKRLQALHSLEEWIWEVPTPEGSA